MLDATIKSQLASYLERLQQPIELVATLGDGDKAQEMRALLDDIALLSAQISVHNDGSDTRQPSFSVGRPGETARIVFAGIPMGHEFTSLVLALLHTGGHSPKIDAELIAQIRAIPGKFHFETFISLSCHNCPDVVQALNPGISHTMIDGALFQDEVGERKIMGVPTVYMNGEPFGQGRMTLEEIVGKIDSGAIAREVEKISTKDAFDVLVVGGGPAGSAAAIYAARKGVRTRVVAERFGGQVLDTLAIENFISIKSTDGPKLSAGLEQHVRDYDVDIMDLQRADALVQGRDGLTEVRLASGAVLKSRSVIISTGARWREMNVPGEKEYRGRGVAYCPHCDGPLFKGKRVAVIGGGNSGVEAAIDLAGVVAHVTLIEFDTALRADAILQKKLFSLTNVDVITNALHNIALEGIFVQIGLLPNTDWLKGTMSLSPRGEIEVDARGQTSLPGVFAAGDCTTVPFKQIIIAVGEGAKASLGAFDHLIRSPIPA
jgi:alkyl hydroperoxide reductase subunit F